MRHLYIAFMFVILSVRVAFSQATGERLIDADYKQFTIGQIVNDIEAKTSYHFYYNPATFDSLRITLNVTQKPVNFILQQAFKNTRYTYAISGQDVFLTRGRDVRTELALGFFSNDAQPVAQQESVQGFAADDGKKPVEATTENKLYQIGVSNGKV